MRYVLQLSKKEVTALNKEVGQALFVFENTIISIADRYNVDRNDLFDCLMIKLNKYTSEKDFDTADTKLFDDLTSKVLRLLSPKNKGDNNADKSHT